ncbi:DNA polymerase (family 10) [Seinonella peptonophila]|uniref:DNA polymerase beta n=1 Tax=Seinonella peptonophila TaxID=112248 RepID=A0A1M4U5R2_9BACL|nr:DNA polymerase/3'-5' exonuclease PolX [Seinonella peptonophila]SHE52025.1 DNA polymerase (family 10) [Seinonella peptonophila]
MNNKEIAAFLGQLADYLELSGANAFRVNAYRRSARAIENQRINLAEKIDDLESIPGIGKGIAAMIRERVTTGQSSTLEECKSKLPPELPLLLKIPGLGPKSIAQLYQKLGITNIAELKQAALEHRIRPLSGFGPKKEEKILAGIETLSTRRNRYLLSEALQVAIHVKKELSTHPLIKQIEYAGSVRRQKEIIKDLDFVIATHHPAEVQKAIITLPEVIDIINQGETKVTVRLSMNDLEIDADFRIVIPDSYASALHHFTGSSEHNIQIRRQAKQLGYKVNEYGITDDQTGELLTFSDETTFFHHLQLPYIIPELREDRGEIAAALTNTLPKTMEQADYLGDLHTHTLYSDGAHSILQMVEAAKAKGYHFLAITDHSRSLKVASGLSIDDLYEQWEEIDRLNEALDDFTILKGSEVDILSDGTLDYPDDILAQLDIVIASVHTSMNQDEKTMTERMIRAMQNPYVHIIGHPTGRVLLRRDPYAVNIDQLFQAAKETGTILELNANPLRLDLNDQHLKKAKDEYQLRFTINTDAHAIPQFDLIEYGIRTARRGWLEKEDILNFHPWSEAKQWLKTSTVSSK